MMIFTIGHTPLMSHLDTPHGYAMPPMLAMMLHAAMPLFTLIYASHSYALFVDGDYADAITPFMPVYYAITRVATLRHT